MVKFGDVMWFGEGCWCSRRNQQDRADHQRRNDFSRSFIRVQL